MFSEHQFLNSSNEEDVLPLGACAQDFVGKLNIISESQKIAETSFANNCGDGVSSAM